MLNPGSYRTLYKETIGAKVNTVPLFMKDGDTADHVFPRSSDMIDAMTQDEIAAFANWYGINGTMIPVGDNLQHRRAAVRRYGASLQEEFAQED